MSNQEKQQVMRYAEISFKALRMELTPEELVEKDGILKELNMAHDAVLELAQKKLFPED